MNIENGMKVINEALNLDQNTVTSIIHYNHNAHLDRDISVLIANYLLKEKRSNTLFSGEKLTIADLYGDTGIRSLRLHKSLTEDGIDKITLVEPFENFNLIAPINFALNGIDEYQVHYTNKYDS